MKFKTCFSFSLLTAVSICLSCCNDIGPAYEPDGDASGDTSICEPGETRDCVCSGGRLGGQACREDRSGWTDCDCESENSSGNPDEGLCSNDPPQPCGGEVAGSWDFIDVCFPDSLFANPYAEDFPECSDEIYFLVKECSGGLVLESDGTFFDTTSATMYIHFEFSDDCLLAIGAEGEVTAKQVCDLFADSNGSATYSEGLCIVDGDPNESSTDKGGTYEIYGNEMLLEYSDHVENHPYCIDRNWMILITNSEDEQTTFYFENGAATQPDGDEVENPDSECQRDIDCGSKFCGAWGVCGSFESTCQVQYIGNS